MTIEDVRELHRRRPFQPFTIHMADGMSFGIPAPEFLAPAPGKRMAFVWHMSDPGFTFIDFNSITRVSFSDAPLPTEPESASQA